jgi:hypothetical protein
MVKKDFLNRAIFEGVMVPPSTHIEKQIVDIGLFDLVNDMSTQLLIKLNTFFSHLPVLDALECMLDVVCHVGATYINLVSHHTGGGHKGEISHTYDLKVRTLEEILRERKADVLHLGKDALNISVLDGRNGNSPNEDMVSNRDSLKPKAIYYLLMETFESTQRLILSQKTKLFYESIPSLAHMHMVAYIVGVYAIAKAHKERDLDAGFIYDDIADRVLNELIRNKDDYISESDKFANLLNLIIGTESVSPIADQLPSLVSIEPVKETQLKHNYERIGNGLYKCYAGWPDGSPLKAHLKKFLDSFIKAPLFLVGFTEEDLLVYDITPEDVKDVRLPFKTMLLDMPKANYRNVLGLYIHPIIYLSAVREDTLYAEMLVSGKEILSDIAAMEKYSAQAELSLQHIKSAVSMKAEKLCVWSVAGFLCHIDRATGEFRTVPNRESILECKQSQFRMSELEGPSQFMACDCENRNEKCEALSELTLFINKCVLKTISYINQPQNYIVKETVEMTSHEQKLIEKGKRPYFGKKPTHVVLDYSQVKSLMPKSETEASHRSPIPHERRGHWRILRSDRYKGKKKTWVREAHVNKGMGWELNKRIYEIIN